MDPSGWSEQAFVTHRDEALRRRQKEMGDWRLKEMDGPRAELLGPRRPALMGMLQATPRFPEPLPHCLTVRLRGFSLVRKPP